MPGQPNRGKLHGQHPGLQPVGADLGGFPIPPRLVLSEVKSSLIDDTLATSNIGRLAEIFNKHDWTTDEAIEIVVSIARGKGKENTRLAAVRFLNQLLDTALERSGILVAVKRTLDAKGNQSISAESVMNIAQESLDEGRRMLAKALPHIEETQDDRDDADTPAPSRDEARGPGHIPPRGAIAGTGLAARGTRHQEHHPDDDNEHRDAGVGDKPAAEMAGLADGE